MSVTIRWTQRAAGRNVGDTETVERTPFIEGVLSAGRAFVVSEDLPESVFPALAGEATVALESIEIPKPRPNRSRFAEPEAPTVEAVDGEASPE